MTENNYSKMEARLRAWGFHEEDIPGMLEELAKLKSIEEEEEILIAYAAINALVSMKVPGYGYHPSFIASTNGRAERMKDKVESIYTHTIPRLKRRIACSNNT